MKTTKRFEEAVTKLYKAFHDGNLDAMDCKHCAVGNMCDTKNNDFWFIHSAENLSNNGKIKLEPSIFKPPVHKYYTQKELINIEYVFLKEWEKAKTNDGKNKELQFKGLCEVVEYLAELDNIPNPMDYSKLFETENDVPKYELIF